MRSQVLAARAVMTPGQLRAAADALFVSLHNLLSGYAFRVLAAYQPRGPEPGGDDLVTRLAGAFPSTTLLLPVLLPDLDLDWAAYDGPASLAPAPKGLLEPTTPRLGPGAIAAADVILVPALAADVSGYRLGRGGGSYDRALARTAATSVALLHRGELFGSIPHEPHDQRVTHALAP